MSARAIPVEAVVSDVGTFTFAVIADNFPIKSQREGFGMHEIACTKFCL